MLHNGGSSVSGVSLARRLGGLMLAAAFAVTTPVAAQTSTFVAGTTYSSDPLNTYTTFGQYMLGMNMTCDV